MTIIRRKTTITTQKYVTDISLWLKRSTSSTTRSSFILLLILSIIICCCSDWSMNAVVVVVNAFTVPHHDVIGGTTRMTNTITTTTTMSARRSIRSNPILQYHHLHQSQHQQYNQHNKRLNTLLYMSTAESSMSRQGNDYSSYYSTNLELIPSIKLINDNIDVLHNKLQNVIDTTSYFRYYSVDILGSCEYMSQELTECYAERCEIYPEDDDEIPDPIRNVDRKEGSIIMELDDWSRWDMPSSDYYDTQSFPEGYTVYDGSDIWKYIHNTICFKEYNINDQYHWKSNFNKIVSGLHSIISAQVISGINQKINSNESFNGDEKWTNPTIEYKRRLLNNNEIPTAIENLYYVFMIVLSAIYQVKNKYEVECQSRTIINDLDSINDIRDILNMPSLMNNPIMSIPALQIQQNVMNDKFTDLYLLKLRCQDLLRVMNCVQCNKCRFHGKISVMGLITSLKILLSSSSDIQPTRVELATLFQTLYKCSSAIKLCNDMQQQLLEQEQ